MKQIFSQLFYEVEKHRDTVLVTLIADRGSAPRKAGAQMLVGAEGRLVGTIGGGAVEGRSIQLSLQLLAQPPIFSLSRRRTPCGARPPAGPWPC